MAKQKKAPQNKEELKQITDEQRVKDLKNLFRQGKKIYGNQTKELKLLFDEGFIKVDVDEDGEPCFVLK